MINHAVGSGGRSMEELITDGYIVGMLDITTHEIADELFGGVLGAGPDRLTAAGKKGIPQVVSVGGLDLLNFGPRDTLPKKFEDERASSWPRHLRPQPDGHLRRRIGRRRPSDWVGRSPRSSMRPPGRPFCASRCGDGAPSTLLRPTRRSAGRDPGRVRVVARSGASGMDAAELVLHPWVRRERSISPSRTSTSSPSTGT